MAFNDFDALYGLTMPSSSYDDSASPNSDHEDHFGNLEESSNSLNLNQSGGGVNEAGEGLQDGEQKKKTKRPPSTVERRAKHNSVERARRESLNGRFMELAAALPTMASVKRPSKSTIVAKSLEYVYRTEDRERALREENASLKKEVEELRAKLGMPPSAAASSPIAIVQSQQRSPANPGRERFNSFDDSASSLSASSLLGCSPASSASFDTSPMTSVQALAAGNPAFNALFGCNLNDTALSTPAADTANLNGKNNSVNSASALPVSGMPFHLGLPAAAHPLAAYDPNYLMALTMQQQHQAAVQQQQLNMGLLPNWPAYSFGINHPVNSGMDYPVIFA